MRTTGGNDVKRHKLVGAFAVLAIVIATSGVALAGTSSRPAVPTRGVTNDTITVGGLGYGAFYADSAVGAQARFDKANSSNEIPGGRKINFLGFRDDGSDQNKDLDEGRKLVQDDQIFAAVPVITPFLGASDFFAQNKTPFIGWGISSGFCDNPFGFGFTGCLTPENPKSAASTWGEMMKKTFNGDTKGKTAAVISEDNDSGKAGAKVISASARAAVRRVVRLHPVQRVRIGAAWQYRDAADHRRGQGGQGRPDADAAGARGVPVRRLVRQHAQEDGQEPHRGTLSASREQELQVRVAERDGTDHVPVSPQAWVGVRHARRVRRHQLLDPGAVRLLQARQGVVRG